MSDWVTKYRYYIAAFVTVVMPGLLAINYHYHYVAPDVVSSICVILGALGLYSRGSK